ncbi:hypothetical protein LRS05_08120 [Flavobacterium sp. J372]|uniref:hypothetical protein n=1 Tax=Flavobacterium sp. J372 TaxID=2898436 RepID=UPI002150D4BE|nr:hypothetical protein [Flavobacterium sp. J372]MCR5862111.1 hypothetical protein [Flavobacterium sp. J372]
MRRIQIVTMALASAAIMSCNEKKTETTPETATTTAIESTTEKHIDTASAAVATGHPNAAPETVAQDAPVVAKVRGTVTAVQNGKDGYTATIKDDSGKLYYATISKVNMDPAVYRTSEVGDRIVVKGQSWKSGDELHIKVEIMDKE